MIYPKKLEEESKNGNNSKNEKKKKEEQKFELTEENKSALTNMMGKENLEKVEKYLQDLERFPSSMIFLNF